MILNERRQSSAHHPRPRLGLLICLLIVLLGSCSPGNSPTIPVSDKQIDIPGLPPDPEAGNLAGKLVGTITQQALGGLRVSVNSKSAISASDGSFLLEGIGSGHLAISIAGEAVYQRVAAIDTSAGRSILLDVIEKQSAFNLNFYRELARGHHPTEGNLLAIQRWTKATPPTIYLDTNAAATDAGIVDAGMLKRAREVIKYMLPVLSGDTYASAPIQVRSFASYDFDAIPENTIAISFDDTLYRQGALGVTFTEPNFTAQATTSLRKAWIFYFTMSNIISRAESDMKNSPPMNWVTLSAIGIPRCSPPSWKRTEPMAACSANTIVCICASCTNAPLGISMLTLTSSQTQKSEIGIQPHRYLSNALLETLSQETSCRN